MQLAPGLVLCERYQIEGVLGEGGMGTVYRASDLRLPGSVWAIKQVRAQQDCELLASRLEHYRVEADLLSSLQHPRLPRIVDFFVEGDSFYLVMDFIAGRNLRQLVESAGPQNPLTVLKWGLDLCEVVEYLHNHEPSIIVRDLKPTNLMFTPAGQVMLIDLGIARINQIGGPTQIMGSSAGTPGYCPAEQYGNQAPSIQGDVYSLAATMLYALTARSPVEAAAVAAGVEEQHALVEPGFLPSCLQKVLAHAMQPNWHHRFSSMALFRQQMQGVRQLLEASSPKQSPTLGQSRSPVTSLLLSNQVDSVGRLMRHIQLRFVQQRGWKISQRSRFLLALEAPWWSIDRLLLTECGPLGEDEANAIFFELASHLVGEMGLLPRRILVVVAASSIPNHQAVAHAAHQHGLLPGWWRYAFLPIDMSKYQLLDSFLPASWRDYNSLNNPILLLNAALGATRPA